MKRCFRCGRQKKLDSFGRDRSRSDGLNVYCRECANRKSRDYSRTHLPERAKTNRKYRHGHQGKVVAWRKKWDDNNRERINLLAMLWKRRARKEGRYHWNPYP